MATGLDMIYNAIGGAGGTLSGHLRETELARLQAEASARAQAERDALLEESNRLMADIDKQYAERTAQAQELGVEVPKPGSIDDQIFRATGGFARSPSLSPGMPMAPGGGTQLPIATPKTEWAPSQAEAAVSADTIRASKDLLSGRPSIDMSRYLKRLEAMQGLAVKAGSRPSTKELASIYKDQQNEATSFMKESGNIADAGRTRQGVLAGSLMGDRALSARDRQGTEFKEAQSTARNNADNAASERMAKEKNALDKKREERMEDKELRLLIGTLNQYGKTKDANQVQMLKDVRAVENDDLSVERFLDAYPTAAVVEEGYGPFKKKVVKGLDLKAAHESLARGDAIISQAREELAKRAGSATAPAENPAIQPAKAGISNTKKRFEDL